MNTTNPYKLGTCLILIIVLGFFVSCRKECFFKALGPMNCNSGYIAVNDLEYYSDRGRYGNYDLSQIVIINDEDTYRQIFNIPPTSPILMNIDFSLQTMVCAEIYIDAGSGMEHQECFCFNPEKDKWLFKIEYSIRGQCKGSKISSSRLFCSVICPKLPDNAFIELDAKNINPF